MTTGLPLTLENVKTLLPHALALLGDDWCAMAQEAANRLPGMVVGRASDRYVLTVYAVFNRDEHGQLRLLVDRAWFPAEGYLSQTYEMEPLVAQDVAAAEAAIRQALRPIASWL